MEKVATDHELSIVGKVDLERTMEVGKEYIIAFPVVCRKAGGLTDNDDGTYREEIKVRVSGSGIIKNELGKELKVRAKGSQSQALRWAITEKFTEAGAVGDREGYYKAVMGRIISAVKEGKI